MARTLEHALREQIGSLVMTVTQLQIDKEQLQDRIAELEKQVLTQVEKVG